jgi:aryl-alcohol dehydrogenase-like predicted oxidoreductase
MMFGHSPGAPTSEPDSRRITDAVVLATKGYGPIGTGPNTTGLSRKCLTRALEASLRRLGTDYIDLYQCHRPDSGTPVSETMATLHGFVQSGEGPLPRLLQLERIADRQGAVGRQGPWRDPVHQPAAALLAERPADRGRHSARLPRQGLGTMIYSPLGGGVLTGKYKPGQPAPEGSRAARGGLWTRMLDDQSVELAVEVGKVAAEIGATPAAVALAWVLSRRGVTTVTIGPRTFEQYEQNVAPHSAGEIVVRGPRQFVGYRDPVLNADAYLDSTWFRTGDLARFDPDGYLIVTDRVKDIIIRGGENISAREVEEALAGAAGIREIAVCAAPDQTWSEIVCAVVVPGGEVPTLESLREQALVPG